MGEVGAVDRYVKVESMTEPYFALCKKRAFPLNLMSFLSTPLQISFLRSFSRIDSTILSCFDMSGLIEIEVLEASLDLFGTLKLHEYSSRYFVIVANSLFCDA